MVSAVNSAPIFRELSLWKSSAYAGRQEFNVRGREMIARDLVSGARSVAAAANVLRQFVAGELDEMWRDRLAPGRFPVLEVPLKFSGYTMYLATAGCKACVLLVSDRRSREEACRRARAWIRKCPNFPLHGDPQVIAWG